MCLNNVNIVEIIKITFEVDSGDQRQSIKCIETDFSVPQQGNPSTAIFFSVYALKDNTNYNGSRPLILLGPNHSKEASSVLEVVRFYKKLMVRKVIIMIIVPRRTGHHEGWGLCCPIGIDRGSL